MADLIQRQRAPKARTSPRGAAWAVARGRLGYWSAWAWIVVLVGASLGGEAFGLKNPGASDYEAVADGPSRTHLLGTDQLGRDELSRLVHGAQASLQVGIFAVALGMSLGLLLGLIAGYFRGAVDLLIGGATDVVLAFPALVFISALVALRGASIRTLVISLAIAMLPTFSRLVRANVLAHVNRDYVTAARIMGATPQRVILREVFPNVLPPALAYAFIVMGVAIVAEGSLSFLGLGIQPPTPSWGSMIASGRPVLSEHPLVVFMPALFLFITALSFNVVGERLRGGAERRTDVVL